MNIFCVVIQHWNQKFCDRVRPGKTVTFTPSFKSQVCYLHSVLPHLLILTFIFLFSFLISFILFSVLLPPYQTLGGFNYLSPRLADYCSELNVLLSKVSRKTKWPNFMASRVGFWMTFLNQSLKYQERCHIRNVLTWCLHPKSFWLFLEIF